MPALAMTDTIFALSSGAPPAAIGVVRVSGPHAGLALERLAGKLPPPRTAVSVRLRDETGETLTAFWRCGCLGRGLRRARTLPSCIATEAAQ